MTHLDVDEPAVQGKGAVGPLRLDEELRALVGPVHDRQPAAHRNVAVVGLQFSNWLDCAQLGSAGAQVIPAVRNLDPMRTCTWCQSP